MKKTYVHVKRSETTRQRPILDLEPVEFSLTEGTDIPPPPQEVAITPSSPMVPALPTLRAAPQEDRLQEKPRSASRHSGPLSSHPVTPIDSISGDSGASAFPFDHQQSGAYNNRFGRPGTASSAPLAQNLHSKASAGGDSFATQPRHNNTSEHQTGAMNPPLAKRFKEQPPPSYQESASFQRPSLASRFLHSRAFTSLRSRNSSSTTLANSRTPAASARPSTDMIGGTVPGPRGTKRPSSPSFSPDTRGTHTFPRMMRKKSMDLLSSARRRSGMWGRPGDEASAMQEQARLERDQEDDEDEPEAQNRAASRMDTSSINGYAPHRSDTLTDSAMGDMSNDQIERAPYQAPYMEPPPVLPELDSMLGKSMEGESMFANIGRD